MNPNPSIKELIRQVLELEFAEYGTATDQALQAILDIIESEVIGEDGEVTGHIRHNGLLNIDIAESYYNALRESQREKLK